jgi:tetratricopeptide (TPR) repeat protein
MRSKLLCLTVILVATMSVVAAETTQAQLKDPYYGEALYYAHQGEYFEAIARLDTELRQYHGVDEPQLDTLHFHINEAEFSVGDLELSYRMHRRAGRAIKAVIEGNVAPAVRNEAIFRLARIYFQKEQNVNALHTIERIEGEVPEEIVNDVAFLKGQIYMVNGRFSDAEKIFVSLEGEDSHQGFSTYNLGISQYAQGKEESGALSLAKAGQIKGGDRAFQAIKDKSNLVLGSKLLDQGKLEQAGTYFDRVRLDGPFSNRALLGMGWADVKRDLYDRALVPWNILVKRNITDSSVQEVLLGVPFAYAKLGLHGRSALMYGSALTAMASELDKLDASIKSINEGKFLKALVREEIKKDKGWVIKLRELAETPETYYLMVLMASHDFQASLQNYIDLEELRKRLGAWAEYYDSYEEIISIRRAYYEPLLPIIDAKFRKLDSKIRLRLEQRDKLDSRLKAMLVAPRPEFLATAEERIARAKISQIEKKLGKALLLSDPSTQHRINRLKGYFLWNIHTKYDERQTEAFNHLADLDKDIKRLKEIHGSFVRTRQAATQSYQGYDKSIARLRIKTRNAQAKVKVLMARQGHMLEVMAVNELVKRRQKLEQAQVKARFAMADSYDRATAKEKQSSVSQPQSTLNDEDNVKSDETPEPKAEQTASPGQDG